MMRGKLLGQVRFLAIIIACLGLLMPLGANASTLSELLARLEKNRQEEARIKAALNQKNIEASSLQSVISGLEDDIAYTNARISNTQDQIDTTNEVIRELKKNISSSQDELDQLNGKLNSAYATLYEMSQTSTMELILQSDSLDDVVSQTQYIQAIQTSLQDDIAKQNDIKAGLEKDKSEATKQKNDLVDLQNSLSESRSSLSSQKSQKDYLLDVTKGEQEKYSSLLAQIRSEAAQISSDIYEARLAEGGFVGGGGTGGYPWAGSCNQVDPRLFYTCQCTSYASWKFGQIHGVYFKNTQPGHGSARYWPDLADDPGNDFHVQTGGTPKYGDIVSWYGPLFPGDQWGHVAIVEHVYSSNDIIVSEYNWKKLSYSERRINPHSYGTPRYIRP